MKTFEDLGYIKTQYPRGDIYTRGDCTIYCIDGVFSKVVTIGGFETVSSFTKEEITAFYYLNSDYKISVEDLTNSTRNHFAALEDDEKFTFVKESQYGQRVLQEIDKNRLSELIKLGLQYENKLKGVD